MTMTLVVILVMLAMSAGFAAFRLGGRVIVIRGESDGSAGGGGTYPLRHEWRYDGSHGCLAGRESFPAHVCVMYSIAMSSLAELYIKPHPKASSHDTSP